MKSKYLMIGAALFAALFLFSGVMLYRQYADEKQSAEAFDNIAALVQEETPPADEPQESEPPQTEQTAFEKYAAVYEQNSDFVGWISTPGTNIDYPVMQTIDNPNYYLKHSFEKQYSDYGVPYVQENCDLGLSDNCVIYGHHMNNGSMFADLCKYADEDFYRAHKMIRCPALANMRWSPHLRLLPTLNRVFSIITLSMRILRRISTPILLSARSLLSMIRAFLRSMATG